MGCAPVRLLESITNDVLSEPILPDPTVLLDRELGRLPFFRSP
jgi:hypothetical protein